MDASEYITYPIIIEYIKSTSLCRPLPFVARSRRVEGVYDINTNTAIFYLHRKRIDIQKHLRSSES